MILKFLCNNKGQSTAYIFLKNKAGRVALLGDKVYPSATVIMGGRCWFGDRESTKRSEWRTEKQTHSNMESHSRPQ